MVVFLLAIYDLIDYWIMSSMVQQVSVYVVQGGYLTSLLDMIISWFSLMDLSALIDGFSGSIYKLVRTDYMLDLVALPMMQRLRHQFKIRTDTIDDLKFSVMILA
jgi:hypothetical protein